MIALTPLLLLFLRSFTLYFTEPGTARKEWTRLRFAGDKPTKIFSGGSGKSGVDLFRVEITCNVALFITVAQQFGFCCRVFVAPFV